MTAPLVAVDRSVVCALVAWAPVPALLLVLRMVERPVPMALPGVVLPGTMAPLWAVPGRPMGGPVARLSVLVLVPVLTTPSPVVSGPVARLPGLVLMTPLPMAAVVALGMPPVVVPAAGVPTRVPMLAQLPVVRVVHVPVVWVPVVWAVAGVRRRGC